MKNKVILASVLSVLAFSAVAGCSQKADSLAGPPTPAERKAFNGGPMPDYAKKQMAEWFAKHAAAQKTNAPSSGTPQ